MDVQITGSVGSKTGTHSSGSSVGSARRARTKRTIIGSALLAVAVGVGVALTSTASAQPATSVAELSLGSPSSEANLPAWPVLSQNRVPNAVSVVKSLQYLLNTHGAHLVVDGFFGSQTDAAVRAFQGSHELVVDGVVGGQTWSRLIVTVQRGDVGPAVMAVQETWAWRTVDGTPDSPPLLVVDGVFGPVTDQRVREFQQTLASTIDTPVDGIVGPVTWQAMMTDYLED
jgi:peptidoglycan hydrolase-like protein with peptidoglycan-binding domain